MQQLPEQSDPAEPSFLETYIQYTSRTECPTFFHRWAAISALGAWLARDVHFTFGHFTLYPNMYCMLIGAPGTRKTTAIKIATKLLARAGYKHFAAKKTRQEKWLLDLAEHTQTPEDILDKNLFGAYDASKPAENYIAADEFGNFIGAGNLDFMSILGELWDYDGTYDYRLKNSDSIHISNPTINILGGTTATEFNRIFPQEAIGQGFFSRLILIHDEPSGIKYTIPPVPDADLENSLLAKLAIIKERMQGEAAIAPDAYELLDKIYHTWEGIPDSRFEHYTNRRLTHLIKLCLVVTTARLSLVIEVCDIIYANTVLTMTEHLMPKALGEFGKGRHSDVSHKVLQLLNAAEEPTSFRTLWMHVHNDLERRDQLMEIITNLQMADKVQVVDGAFLGKKQVMTETCSEALDWSILQESERRLLGASSKSISLK